MFLSPYYSKQLQQDASKVVISAQQASDFAKNVAGDYNPIHDVGAKRFCVPGDLLFALVLTEHGLSQNMQFNFEGMVGDNVELLLDPSVGDSFNIQDTNGKSYLNVSRSGELCECDTQKAAFIKSYVAFSGLNFIHVLVPLMREHQVMINPARPLVIYESMAFELTDFSFEEMSLELVEQTLKVDGKRGDVTLNFELTSQGRVIGTGVKTLVLSGLRELEEDKVEQMCQAYEGRKAA
ncbi:DUF3581 domain-containing protein [Shewanella sp. WXL01]|uniref:DUF3581 family protein n=1 Tax=Shewanella maritima TaxID=2520507 RepID=A0A411PG20_9GAMM|nr:MULTISPECIES: DUF3581 domain-containing protein [Shewanella]NKF49329.1 DUF3581 domain-containing protein [Shewanella sp. WXL01]QBF82546.1 DUF3581 family protein [Shewanella maritima]